MDKMNFNRIPGHKSAMVFRTNRSLNWFELCSG